MTLHEALGQVVTFYSYKGGTGRTMALANVACLLAEQQNLGKPILMIDWDLEAPGLHRYFSHEKFQRHFSDPKDFERFPGLIDLFWKFDKAIINSEELDEEHASKILESFQIENFILESDIPNLYLIKAGCFDEDYSRKINEFQWVSFYKKAPELIRLFVEQLANRYQYILIDSRTGVTDTSGICTMLLPEKLVAVFTPNRQSLLGVLDQVSKATNYRRQSDDLRPLVVFPLPSRIEPSEPLLRDKWRFGSSEGDVQGYQKGFEKVFSEVYALSSCDLGAYFDQVQVQHIPQYAYGEEIAVLIDRTRDRLSLARSYENFAQSLTKLSAPWEFEKVIERSFTSLTGAIIAEGNSIIITGRQGNTIVNFINNYSKVCPYPGLMAFREEDEQFFFGRTQVVQLLLERIRRENFLAVVGSSSSGKSSIINAGLIPNIKSGRQILNREQWQIIVFRPGSKPLQSLSLALGMGFDLLTIDHSREELKQLGKAIKMQLNELFLASSALQVSR
jgi:cellulose biosynthesis protein BcsQ